MPDRPFISVVVPVYNGERFLKACIDSLKNQSYDNYEIIIVDDGSTDGSPELVTPPAQLVSTSGRTGAGAARNLGAKSAKGDFLLFTDADVEAPQNWVAKTAQTIVEKKVKCGGGGYAGPIEDTFIQWFAFEELAWRRRNFHGEVETLVSNNLFCERKLFEEFGGFPETYCAASSEDMEFSWKVSRKHKLWWDKDNGVFHNFTPTVSAYLSQQSRFAKDAVPMIFGNKNLTGGKTHHPKSFYLEVALTGLAIFLLLLLQPLSALVCILWVLFINRGLLAAMSKKHRRGFVLKSMSLIIARNATIIFGALRGASHMLMRKS
jgi:glycosyltransferase involved in cell wall biosynthesis